MDWRDTWALGEGGDGLAYGDLEECLEALGILLKNQGRSQAAPLAAGVSQGELGAASVRRHDVNAECLGILDILEPES